MTVADMSFEPLSPVSYLDRAAEAHGERIAVVDGDRWWTYTQFRERCRRLAGALVPLAGGRPVAVLAPNTPVLRGDPPLRSDRDVRPAMICDWRPEWDTLDRDGQARMKAAGSAPATWAYANPTVTWNCATVSRT